MTRLLVEYKRQAFEAEQNESGRWTLFFVHSNTIAHQSVHGTSFSLLDNSDDTFFIFGCDVLVGPFKSVVDAMKHDTYDPDMDKIVDSCRACEMQCTYDLSVYTPKEDSDTMKELMS